MLHTATFWLAISMGLFLLIAGKPMVKGITGMVDKRRAEITAQLTEATKLRQEAEALLADRKAKQAEALLDAAAIRAEAVTDAVRIRAEAATKLTEVLAAREAQALAKIAEAEAQATRDAKNLAATLAVEAAREILTTRISSATNDALVDKAIADLPAKLAS